MHPFNLGTYRQMLATIKTDRKSIRYSEIDENQEFVLWRHDCDMSLNRALRIAELDAEYGVKSTFFVNPHSEFYSILEKKQLQIIKEIISLGHDVGLHLDAAYHQNAETKFDIEEAIRNDISIMNLLFDAQINAFSFHNPTQEILRFNDYKYGGLVNCYSEVLRGSVEYSSDSNGYWRHKPIPEVLGDSSKSRLQILTHPEWWLEQESLPRNRVLRCVFGRAIELMNQYDGELERHPNRQNTKIEYDGENDYIRALEVL